MDHEEFESTSDCEDYEDYSEGGYHPVTLGEKFNHNYIVIQKLGWGHFSTVWLVQNEKTQEYGALKIQRSKKSHSESAIDEMKILNEIRKHENDEKWVQELKSLENLHPEDIHPKICKPLLLHDNFTHHGIHGEHYCSMFEILGPNLLDLIHHYQFQNEKMPLWLVKKITIDVLVGLIYLHEHCDIIHTDLKPENIMIKLEPKEEESFINEIKNYKVKPISMMYLQNLQAEKNSKEVENEKKEDNDEKELEEFDFFKCSHTSEITNEENWNENILKWKNVKIELNKNLFFKIVDMGNACFSNRHFAELIQTREYRSPEVILGYSYAHNTDIWSLACIVFELLTNNFLFQPTSVMEISEDEDHLFKIIEVLGPMRKEYSLGGTHSSKFFNKKAKLLHNHPKDQFRLSQMLNENYGYSLEDSVEIEEFLLPMLEIEDENRVSARECLKHKWLWK